ncbi:MAG TPA: gluconokinase [Chloroflexia bacterium]|nr:gluconokinase [Chloroflexia bacterium]
MPDTDWTPPFVLSLDAGSSSLRANVHDATGRLLPHLESQHRYPITTTPDGGLEIDPDELVGRLFAAIDRTIAQAGSLAGQIAGVGFCSLVGNVMGVDEQGAPVTPLYTWADTRSAPQAEELRRTLDEAAAHQRTGCLFHSSYLPARLLWLRETMPEEYGRAARWVSLGDYAYWLMFGRYAESRSVASWTGLLNRRTLDWDAELLSALGVDADRLPPLCDAYDAFQGLQGEFARRWPALASVPWFPCVGDGVTSNIGSGCSVPERWAMQVGTSSALRVLLPRAAERIPRGLWEYRLDGQYTLLGGALSEGGNVLTWLRDTLGENAGQLETEAAAMEPDSHGLTFLPYVAGERSPGWDSAARAAIAGITLATRPAHMYRAAQEAIAYGFGAVYDLMREVQPEPEQVVASGGALLYTQGWAQIMADVLGRPVTASGEEEASARGAALVALRGLGLIASFDEHPAALRNRYLPDPARHEVYTRARERQRTMYGAMKPLW